METTLEGKKLRLEPIALKHLDSLARHVLFPKNFIDDFGGCVTRQDVEKEIQHCLQARTNKQENGFAIIDKTSGEAVGYSNYMFINRRDYTIEIGRTRIGVEYQKSYVNTETKLLMLQHAFEVLKAQRVAFKVDAFNFNSQRAVRRLGAKYEGEIRNYRRLPDGRMRDYQWFSIIESEWPNVKKTLHGYMEKYNVSSATL